MEQGAELGTVLALLRWALDRVPTQAKSWAPDWALQWTPNWVSNWVSNQAKKQTLQQAAPGRTLNQAPLHRAPGWAASCQAPNQAPHQAEVCWH